MHQNLATYLKVQIENRESDERADLFLRKIYELYSDFALKNPFYSLEMPIRAGNHFHFTLIHPIFTLIYLMFTLIHLIYIFIYPIFTLIHPTFTLIHLIFVLILTLTINF